MHNRKLTVNNRNCCLMVNRAIANSIFPLQSRSQLRAKV